MSYDMIDRFLRNNLYDDDYKDYSDALDELCVPKRTWIGLTDAEIDALDMSIDGTVYDFVRAVEAKLKEKQNGTDGTIPE
jgi:hypothetical protein